MKRNIDWLTRKQRRIETNRTGKLSEKRMQRMVENNRMSVDHLIAKDNWWTNHPDNRDEKNVRKHRWKHNYLWIKLPHEQIKAILEENLPVLYEETREQIVEEIEQILEYYLSNKEFYKKACFKKGTMPTK